MPSVAQKATGHLGSINPAASGTQSFGSAVTVGNRVCVCVWNDITTSASSGDFTVTDNKGNTYTFQDANAATGGATECWVAECPVTTGGSSFTVSIKNNLSGAAFIDAAIFEISGVSVVRTHNSIFRYGGGVAQLAVTLTGCSTNDFCLLFASDGNNVSFVSTVGAFGSNTATAQYIPDPNGDKWGVQTGLADGSSPMTCTIDPAGTDDFYAIVAIAYIPSGGGGGASATVVSSSPPLEPVKLPPQGIVIPGAGASNPAKTAGMVTVTGGQPQTATGSQLFVDGSQAATLPQYVDLPPASRMLNGRGTGTFGPTTTGFGLPAQPPVVVESILAALGLPQQVTLPPQPELLVGFGNPAQPPQTIESILAALAIPRLAELPPPQQVLAGAGQAAQPPVVLEAALASLGVPKLPELPIPEILVMNGTGSGALDQTSTGSGQPAQPPVVLESPLASMLSPRLAELATPQPLVLNGQGNGAIDQTATGFGLPAQVAQLVVAAALPPSAALPPQTELVAGVVPVAAALAGTVAYGSPPQPALLPPAPELITGHGQAAQPPQLITQVLLPPLVVLPPQPELVVGANPVVIASGSTVYGVPPAPALLPPAPELVVGHGVAAQVAQLVAAALVPPATLLPPVPELVVGFGLPAQVAVVLVGQPPPVLAALPPPQLLLVGHGLPAQVATLAQATFPPPSAGLPPLAELVAGVVVPAPPGLLEVALPPVVALPPLPRLLTGFGQAAQVATLVRATFDWSTPQLLVHSFLVAGFGQSATPGPVRTLLLEMVVNGITLREQLVDGTDLVEIPYAAIVLKES